ncbi:unnamed protein product [Litomosoides sigmodontis]|uniref:Cysteine rich repeat-containing domain protein n=1 Tax=Litomosoides sigmodontis TaxID=42156 RepID=A0A3P6SNH1_LITSI|nr:unnamed protein product [Litomosoides sigmodontis]
MRRRKLLPILQHFQLRTRARRCVCISISCGCYQPSSSRYRQPPSLPHRRPTYRQQFDVSSPCITNCLQGCLQHQRSAACLQICTNLCGTQTAHQQPGAYKLAPYQPYQYEPPTRGEVVDGQQSVGETCINVCMPGCESQCIQKSTPTPTMPQQNGPIPVVQSQTPSYYPSEEYEPAAQQSPSSENTICVHLCMPSCESQCIERTTTPAVLPQTEQPNDVYYLKPTSYVSSQSHQNFVQVNQTSFALRPQHYSGTAATICIPVCMPSCQARCTENQGQSGRGREYATIGPTQADLLPYEISISLPQSIQQLPDCMNLCLETCMQQCVGQNQPEDQCRPSCTYTCQESCAQSPTNTASSVQQREVESEVYETVAPTFDNSMSRRPLPKTFLLRSPPYYRQVSLSQPQVTGCLSGPARAAHCKCPSGYVTCLSEKSAVSQQQCCRKRR